MVIFSKKEYLEAIRPRYLKSSKKDKSAILTEFCANCGYHPKHAIRLLNCKKYKPKRKPGKQVFYDPKIILKPLKTIWLATDQMCSKKLKAAIKLWLPFYEIEYGKLTDLVCQQLLKISAATIDRLLKPTKVMFKGKGFCTTKPGALLKNQIPIRTDNWDIKQPGFLEADTVAHCGNSLAGEFVWSITFTDICSGWTANRATWTKCAVGVSAQIKNMRDKLPFDLLGFDCDNGSEFLNDVLLNYFTEEKIAFTRSRPYHKNDNAHVEQKNWTHVRHLLGYDRFDKPELVDLINDLYTSWNHFQNFFCPNMKLIEKIRINSKYRKKYDQPKTPFQRLIEHPMVLELKKTLLINKLATLNPFSLKKDIILKQKKVIHALRST